QVARWHKAARMTDTDRADPARARDLRRRCGGNRRDVALGRLPPSRCHIGTASGPAAGPVPGGGRDGSRLTNGVAVTRPRLRQAPAFACGYGVIAPETAGKPPVPPA